MKSLFSLSCGFRISFYALTLLYYNFSMGAHCFVFAYLFILFLALLGLRCRTRAFSRCREQGLLQARRAGFSLWWLPSLQSTGCSHRSISSGSAGPHQLWPAGPGACRPQQLWPRALQHGLGSCGIRAQWLCGMWNPSRPGIEPLSPALEGRLLSTVPSGKSWSLSFEKSP